MYFLFKDKNNNEYIVQGTNEITAMKKLEKYKYVKEIK